MRRMRGDWADDVMDEQRRIGEFLLDWHDEIAAAKAYSQTPVRIDDTVLIASEHVIARLGPELSAMTRATARLERLARGTARTRRSTPDHPDVRMGENLAWGARQVLAVGLGVHLELSLQHATWLAEALSGYEHEYIDLARKRVADRDGGPPQ
jgi:hypothetical protein